MMPTTCGIDATPTTVPARRRRGPGWRAWLIAGAATPAGLVGAANWYFRPDAGPPLSTAPLPAPDVSATKAAEVRLEAVAWPEGHLEGQEAKLVLRDLLGAALARLEAVQGYTATLRRQERVGTTLGPVQTLQVKFRHRPFAVYLRFVEPDAGKEAIYAEGMHDNHVVAHGGRLTRLLLPQMKVPPDSAVAMAGNRHPITDAGLLNLTRKLYRYRELDLDDPGAETVLDRVVDADGTAWLRSTHQHIDRSKGRPFAFVEVLYDPETKLPHRIDSYDWPEDAGGNDRQLAESYRYDDLVLDAPLTDLDFDHRNPAYEFRRF